jgi:hypothetical protein
MSAIKSLNFLGSSTVITVVAVKLQVICFFLQLQMFIRPFTMLNPGLTFVWPPYLLSTLIRKLYPLLSVTTRD